MLKKLASAHDSYVEISNNLREGTKVLIQHNTLLDRDKLYRSNAVLTTEGGRGLLRGGGGSFGSSWVHFLCVLIVSYSFTTT